MTWIFFTCFAAVIQALRNAFQSQLSKQMSIAGVTLSRFLWGGPLAVIYLVILYQWRPADLPEFSRSFYFFVFGAAIMQTPAHLLMVILFKQKNYTVGAGLAKCEAAVAAVIGVFFFGTVLSPLSWLGVLLGGIAVLILSSTNGLKSLSPKTCLIGLACSSGFALTSLWAREASLTIDLPFLHRAAWALLFVIGIQILVFSAYLALKDIKTLALIVKAPRLVIMTSITSFIASLCWFTAITLKDVAHVKTLGQIEILVMVLISIFWLKERVKPKDLFALLLIAGASMLFILF